MGSQMLALAPCTTLGKTLCLSSPGWSKAVDGRLSNPYPVPTSWGGGGGVPGIAGDTVLLGQAGELAETKGRPLRLPVRAGHERAGSAVRSGCSVCA